MYMDLLDLFAEKYLESYDTEIVVNKIHKNEDSFFHALEYASGDSLQGPEKRTTCINLAREDVCMLEIDALGKIKLLYDKKSDKEFIRRMMEEINEIRFSIEHANEGVISISSKYKEKVIFILKQDTKAKPEFTVELFSTLKKPEINKNNIIILIQNDKTFSAFKNSHCKRVYPNDMFIHKLNSTIQKSLNPAKTHEIRFNEKQLINGIFKYSCDLEIFDNELFHSLRYIEPRQPSIGSNTAISSVTNEDEYPLGRESARSRNSRGSINSRRSINSTRSRNSRGSRSSRNSRRSPKNISALRNRRTSIGIINNLGFMKSSAELSSAERKKSPPKAVQPPVKVPAPKSVPPILKKNKPLEGLSVNLLQGFKPPVQPAEQPRSKTVKRAPTPHVPRKKNSSTQKNRPSSPLGIKI